MTVARREQLRIELWGAGHELVRRWVPEGYDELDALKKPGIDHEGQHYRYVGLQDFRAVFVLDRRDKEATNPRCGKPGGRAGSRCQLIENHAGECRG